MMMMVTRVGRVAYFLLLVTAAAAALLAFIPIISCALLWVTAWGIVEILVRGSQINEFLDNV